MTHWRRLQYTLCIATILLVGTFFLFPDISFAQTIVETQAPNDFGVAEVDQNIALSNTNIVTIVLRIIRVLIGLLGIVVLVLFLYAGFMWMTSAGQEERIAKAKKTMINATIGLLIIFSSFMIVQFIINALSEANGIRQGGGGGGNTPEIVSFSGSGSLGSAVLDHYPYRDQTNVARNTKVTITFREEVALSSVFKNTNGTCLINGTTETDPTVCAANENAVPLYGDCLESSGATFNWETQCDHINTERIQLSYMDGASTTIVSGAGLAAYTDDTRVGASTIVIRPFEPLGNAISPVSYTALFTGVTTTEGLDIFRNSRYPYYTWSFETGTTLDTDPPIVVETYPAVGEIIPKNHMVQITFDEPMDPIMVQGSINTTTNPFTNIIFNRTDVVGRWELTNGYRTIEFLPSTSCGTTNSCGEEMYCLPVTCGTTGCEDAYTSLIRTAQVFNEAEPWEAYPFTGVMDMAGNSLDGDADGIWDGIPARSIETATEINSGELAADNASVSFIVKNEIDRRQPYIHTIRPEVDAMGVLGSEPLEIQFSMPMQYGSFRHIYVDEYSYNEDVVEDTLWYTVRASQERLTEEAIGAARRATRAQVQHRQFGPDGMDLSYFVSVSGTVRGINQNCMYPGRGPSGLLDSTDTCVYELDANGAVQIDNGGCIDFDGLDSENDTGCAYTYAEDTDSIDQTQASVDACISVLRNQSSD